MGQPSDGAADATDAPSLPSPQHSQSSDEWAVLVSVGETQQGEERDVPTPLPDLVPLPHVPSFKMLASPIPSLELLNPSPDSDLRKSNLFAATFNLIATIVGGGVLSMPLSLAKSGLVLGTFLMIFAAIITDFSLYILCACARKTGASSYGAVARHAFGPGLEVLTTLVIFAYLFMVLIAFMVLVKGIWAPIIMVMLNYYWPGAGSGKQSDDIILLCAVMITMPFFLSRDLHGLRHSCFASFSSIIVLCVAMIYRAWQKNLADPDLFHASALYVTSSVPDALFSYPIIALAFVSSFNVVEVHCGLVNPSRKRVRKVIHGAVFWSFLLMYVFSLAGYCYAFEKTDGNILLNFDPTDQVVFIGRIGCGVCTLLAMPMSLLPCRDAILALPARFREWQSWRAATQTRQVTEATLPTNGDTVFLGSKQLEEAFKKGGEEQDEEKRPLITDCHSPLDQQKPMMYSSTTINTTPPSSNSTSESSSPIPHSPTATRAVSAGKMFSVRDQVLHWGSTLGILSACYAGAVLAPGVAIVWSIVGSSLAFLVQYILPAACYIKLRRDARKARGGGKGGRYRTYIVCSWILLVVSCVGATACTVQTVWRIFFMEKD